MELGGRRPQERHRRRLGKSRPRRRPPLRRLLPRRPRLVLVSGRSERRQRRPARRRPLRRPALQRRRQRPWWEGLDPQDLYAQYHEVGKYDWPQAGNPPLDKAYIEKFFNRTIDLINKYNPDLLYFDDTVLPIYPPSDIGLRIAAYLYNTNLAKHGKLEAVLTGKGLKAEHAQGPGLRR